MSPETGNHIAGFTHSPASWLEQTFMAIGESDMQTLPFYRPHLPVKALGFTLFEAQWLGALLTPWMMSLMILPGPGQIWPRRQVGERLVLALPRQNAAFRVGETAQGQQYLACSLLSPLPASLSAESARDLATDSLRLALSLPVRTRSEVNHSLRALLRARLTPSPLSAK